MPVLAQTESQIPIGSTLTIPRAVEIAMENSPGPEQAIQTIAAAENRYKKSLAALYPTLSLSGSANGGQTNYYKHYSQFQDNQRGEREASMALSGSYTLYDGFFKRFSSQVSLYRLESEKRLGDDVKRLLAEAVKLSFQGAILVKRQTEIFREDLSFQENMLRESRLKREADLVAEPHVLNFLLRRNQARKKLLAKERDYNIQLISLTRVMGIEDTSILTNVTLAPFPSDLLSALALPEIDICLDTAIFRRPDLQALEATKTAADYTMQAGKSRFSPTLSLVGEAGIDEDKTYYKDYNNTSAGLVRYEAGLKISWALYDAGSRRYEVLAAGAEMNRVTQQIREKWLGISSEVKTAHAQIRKAEEQYYITLENIDIQTRQPELVTEQLRAGEVDLAFLNETQASLVSLEQELVLAGFSILSGMAALESAMGLSPEITENTGDGQEASDSETLKSPLNHSLW